MVVKYEDYKRLTKEERTSIKNGNLLNYRLIDTYEDTIIVGLATTREELKSLVKYWNEETDGECWLEIQKVN